MNNIDCHAVYQIRRDLKAENNPLEGNDRKRSSDIAALEQSIHEMNTCFDNLSSNQGDGDVRFKEDQRYD